MVTDYTWLYYLYIYLPLVFIMFIDVYGMQLSLPSWTFSFAVMCVCSLLYSSTSSHRFQHAKSCGPFTALFTLKDLNDPSEIVTVVTTHVLATANRLPTVLNIVLNKYCPARPPGSQDLRGMSAKSAMFIDVY